MKPVLTNLNDYLREKRMDRGLSQLDVAKVLGYASPQFVSNWERGMVAPPLQTLATLIDLYEMPSQEVVNRILTETRRYLEEELKPRRKALRPKASPAGARKKRANR